MKYIIGVLTTTLLLSCSNRNHEIVTVPGVDSSSDMRSYRLKHIDNCEYIIYETRQGNASVFGITHKGNCKNHTRASYNK